MGPIRTSGDSAEKAHPSTGLVVALRHTLPDGTSHIDLLIAPPRAPCDPIPERLLTYRLAANPLCSAKDHSFNAERLPDHRSRYLDYEGDIGGGRGRVTRESSAPLADWQAAGTTWSLLTTTGIRLTGTESGGGNWSIERSSTEV